MSAAPQAVPPAPYPKQSINRRSLVFQLGAGVRVVSDHGSALVGGRQSVAVLLGLAAVIGGSVAPLPAMGQILDPAPRVERPPPRRAPQAPGIGEIGPTALGATSPGAFATSVSRAIDETFFDDDGRFRSGSAPAGADGEVADAETRIRDAAEEDDPFGVAEGRPREIPIAQDGDPVSLLEPPGTGDGIIDLNRPNPFTGEEEAALIELRSAQDFGPLGLGGGAFDPLLLQAQETNPVFSNRPLAEFEPEPFVPLGMRLGSFTLFTSVEADGDYNSNLFASPVALGDYSLEVRPAARLASNWSTHAVEVRASGDLTFHDKFPTEDDRAYLVEGLGRLDVTRRTNLQGAISRAYAQEGRNAINASSLGTRPNITVDRGRAAFNHRFNRLSVQLRGGIVDTSYSNDTFDDMLQSNSDRDYTLFEEAVRPQWEFMPTLFVFADLAFNQRHYSIPAFSDGKIRSSTGERYRAGVSFGQIGEFLRGEVSLGYGSQTPDNPTLKVIDGLLVDANLAWRVTPLSTLLFTATTDVAETTTFDSGGVLERTYGLEVRHSFQTRLVGIAGLGYFTRDFVGAGINENQLTAAAGLEYYLSRHAVLFGRYQHTVFDTTSPNGNYTAEEAQLGVRLRQ